jgi:hypothetical protein
MNFGKRIQLRLNCLVGIIWVSKKDAKLAKPRVQGYFLKDQSLDFESVLRNLFIRLTQQKGYFALHGDELSYLAYDIQFYLLSINQKITSQENFVKEYPKLVAINPDGISTHGYGDFFSAWFETRKNENAIVRDTRDGYRFTETYKQHLLKTIKKYA